jgi:SAM-dependent methyltransferase
VEAKSRAAVRADHYWDHVVDAWNQERADGVWRAHSDAINTALLDRWLPPGPIPRLLKTDLFDEAVAEGVYPLLQSRAQHVIGIDVSQKAVDAACARYPRLQATAADVLQLPFADGQFHAIASVSTLDHFDSPDKIVASVRELHRILAPGGTLVVTLDNGSNPAVALRNSLPYPLLRGLRLIPYRMGVTFTAGRFLGLLRSCSFDIRDVAYTIHCPRLAAAVTSRVVGHFGGAETRSRFLRLLSSVERMDRLPTHALTGYYVAVLARK